MNWEYKILSPMIPFIWVKQLWQFRWLSKPLSNKVLYINCVQKSSPPPDRHTFVCAYQGVKR